LEELFEESEINNDIDIRKKKLMRLKFSKLPFVLRHHFQKNNIPEYRYLEFIKNMDDEILNDLIPREPP
jgi:hypothetical protein